VQIFVPRERHPGEIRVPIVPQTVKKLVQRGAELVVETGIGEACRFVDGDYDAAGARVTGDIDSAMSSADMVLRLRKPAIGDVNKLKQGCVHVSFLDPFNEPELIDAFANAHVTAISMEMIPRTTLAQKMDALSSQANLAGYEAVIVAAERLRKVLPMMMTPAGTIPPSRVFVIGVGVAGLQAIATAKRLGARVEAFDTRPVVEEQVQSLGAKFVKVDLGETGQTEQGYARELTEEQQARQREAMANVCAEADIVITTAQLFGRKAPVIITKDMIARMKPGSVIVDLAVESGGNVEGSEPGKEVDANGVTIVGLRDLPARAAINASQMYSANLGNLIEHFWDNDAKAFKLNLDDEILAGCVITHGGALVNETIKKLRSGN
jgi:NAD(P) transhydrogenase subunit alpha